MHYRNKDGTLNRVALSEDAKLYDSLFEISDRAEQIATIYSETASDPEVSAAFSNVAEALRDTQVDHLANGAGRIIICGEDEAVSCAN